MRKTFCILLATASLWAAPWAHGLTLPSVMEGMSTSGAKVNELISGDTLRSLLSNTTEDPKQNTLSGTVGTAIEKPTGTAGIDMLVAGYQDAQKAEARKLFAKIIDMFEPVAQKLEVPAYDMGSAAAALIAGSYAAYKNEVLPNEYFKPLAQQMQQVFMADAKFAQMSAQEKQRMYQVLVGTGMFLTMAQMDNMKNPDPQITAQLQSAGKEFLSRFTHMEAASIKLDENGLSQVR